MYSIQFYSIPFLLLTNQRFNRLRWCQQQCLNCQTGHDMPNHVFPSCQQLWSEVCWQTTCQSSLQWASKNTMRQQQTGKANSTVAQPCIGITMLTPLTYQSQVTLQQPSISSSIRHQPCHAPSQWSQPNYGAKVQLTDPINSTNKMTQEQTKVCQQVVRNFLFYT